MWNFISSAIGALTQNANTQNAINANKDHKRKYPNIEDSYGKNRYIA